jgi:hypothetical protein
MTTSGSPLVSGRWLRPLRIGWMCIFVLTLCAVVASVPIMDSQAHELCLQSSCTGPQLTLAQMRSLHRLGLSLDFYGAMYVALNVAFAIVYCSIACLIFVRRSQERMALLSAYFLLVFGGLTFPGTTSTLADDHPLMRFPAGLTVVLGAALLSLFFFLFPSGRFVPGWGRWLVPVLPIVQAPGALFPDSALTLGRLPVLVGPVPFLGILVLMLASQVYRFRAVSTPMERQQTKWVVLGVGVGLGGFLVYVVVGNSLLTGSSQNNFLVVVLPNTVMYLLMMLIPLSIALAILRYNLWETDLLINRALVYGSLTISLAGFYLLGVLAMQSLFRAVTGQSTDLAVAIVTLAVAALFTPWRRRVQSFIDRRFYRRKYDASRILAGFTGRLRDEVDLGRLETDILAVVSETVQPDRASLWLVREARE